MIAVRQESAGFFKLLHDGGRAFALHDSLVAHGSQVQGNLAIFGKALDVACHGVADVDSRRIGSDHEAARIAVVYQKIDMVTGDFVGGKLDFLPEVQFRGIRVQETLDFFACRGGTGPCADPNPGQLQRGLHP